MPLFIEARPFDVDDRHDPTSGLHEFGYLEFEYNNALPNPSYVTAFKMERGRTESNKINLGMLYEHMERHRDIWFFRSWIDETFMRLAYRDHNMDIPWSLSQVRDSAMLWYMMFPDAKFEDLTLGQQHVMRHEFYPKTIWNNVCRRIIWTQNTIRHKGAGWL